MERSNSVAYCSIFLFIYIFAFFLNSPTNSQSINDPFPTNPGPEPEPTTRGPYTGCPAECSKRLDEAMQLIADLESKISSLNTTVLTRLNSVGSGGGGSVPADLPARVSRVESHLFDNITKTTEKLSIDLAATNSTLSKEIADTRTYIDTRLATLPSGTGSGGGGADFSSPVFKNITARLDDLERNKVQVLIDENNVWRKNFQVVNKTFSKMRKSSYSNEVIVVG